jgi:hypothetical protein
MEQGDHSRCSIELRACPEHDDEHFSIVEREQDTLSGLHEADASGPPTTSTEQPLNEDWVHLKPIPPEIDQKLVEWFSSESDSIGFCFLCGHSIQTEGDLIPDTNTHNCVEGQLFEEETRRGEL